MWGIHCLGGGSDILKDGHIAKGDLAEKLLGNTYSMMTYRGSIVHLEVSELDLNALKVYEKEVSTVKT